MRIIYDNIIFSLQKAGGISLYWAELIKRLKAKSDIMFFESPNNNIFRKSISLAPLLESKMNSRILRYLPFLRKLPTKSIFHSSYYRICLQKDIAIVTTIHDFTYEHFRTGIPKHVHSLQKGLAIKKSDGIICVSQNTKKDLMKFYPNTDESKITVIYLGVDETFKQTEKGLFPKNLQFLKNKKYLLYVGERTSYKNFTLVVEVLKKLDASYHLVVVGGKEFDASEQLLFINIKHRIHHIGKINSNTLNVIYNNAFCLVYPSNYEGFGIPLVEAMATGCPVISTNISSIPEVVDDAAILIDEPTVNNMLKAISQLENNEVRTKLISSGLEQAKKYSWDKCFEETYNFYKKIYSKKVIQ